MLGPGCLCVGPMRSLSGVLDRSKDACVAELSRLVQSWRHACLHGPVQPLLLGPLTAGTVLSSRLTLATAPRLGTVTAV